MITQEAKNAMDKPETFVPHHMRGGYVRYIEHNISPGSFGIACLNGDHEAALIRADHVNKNHVDSQIEWCKRFINVTE